MSNPERFAPLHAHAVSRLIELDETHAVQLEEGVDLASGPGEAELARPTLRLTPRDQNEAPIQVAFTRFPGLHVWVGEWYREALPACGCDACGETIESTTRRLDRLIDAAVGGLLFEELTIPDVGDAWQTTTIGGSGGSRARIPRARALEMSQGGAQIHRWRAWSTG